MHAPRREEIEIPEDAVVSVDAAGTIDGLHRPGEAGHAEALAEGRRRGVLTELPEGRYVLPGMVDLHIHAPQWPQLGKCLHLPLEEWLVRYTFPLEARYADSVFAERVYTSLIEVQKIVYDAGRHPQGLGRRACSGCQVSERRYGVASLARHAAQGHASAEEDRRDSAERAPRQDHVEVFPESPLLGQLTQAIVELLALDGAYLESTDTGVLVELAPGVKHSVVVEDVHLTRFEKMFVGKVIGIELDGKGTQRTVGRLHHVIREILQAEGPIVETHADDVSILIESDQTGAGDETLAGIAETGKAKRHRAQEFERWGVFLAKALGREQAVHETGGASAIGTGLKAAVEHDSGRSVPPGLVGMRCNAHARARAGTDEMFRVAPGPGHDVGDLTVVAVSKRPESSAELAHHPLFHRRSRDPGKSSVAHRGVQLPQRIVVTRHRVPLVPHELLGLGRHPGDGAELSRPPPLGLVGVGAEPTQAMTGLGSVVVPHHHQHVVVDDGVAHAQARGFVRQAKGIRGLLVRPTRHREKVLLTQPDEVITAATPVIPAHFDLTPRYHHGRSDTGHRRTRAHGAACGSGPGCPVLTGWITGRNLRLQGDTG